MGDKNPQKVYNTHYKLSVPATGNRGRGFRGIRGTSGRGSVGNSNPHSSTTFRTTITVCRSDGAQNRDVHTTGGDSGFMPHSGGSAIRGSRDSRTVTNRGRVYRGAGVRGGGGCGVSTQDRSNSEESSFISRVNGNRKSDDLSTTRAGIYRGTRGRGGDSILNISNDRESNLPVETCKGCNGTGICGLQSSTQTVSNRRNSNSSFISHGNGTSSSTRGRVPFHCTGNKGREDSSQNWQIVQHVPKSSVPKPEPPKSSFLPTEDNDNGNNNYLIGNYFILGTIGFAMYQYSVKVQYLNTKTNGVPKDALAEDCREIVRSIMRQDYPTIPYVYDGVAHLYVLYRLPHNLVNQAIRHVFRGQVFMVKLEAGSMETNRVDLAEVNRYYASKKNGGPEFQVSEPVLTLYNLIFRNLFEQKKYTEVDGNYFDITKRNENVQEEDDADCKIRLFDLVSGFSASVVLTEKSGLALHLSLKSAVAISPKFTCACIKEKYLSEKCDQTLDRFVLGLVALNGEPLQNARILEELTQPQAESVSEIVKDLKFKTPYNHYKQQFTIKRIELKKPEEHRFYSNAFEREMTTKEFYVEAYNYTAKSYPLVVAVYSGHNEEMHIPMELCHLLGDQFVPHSKIAESLLPKEFPTLSPEDYLNKAALKIKEIKRINFDFLASFQIRLVSKPMEFPYHVLPLPQAGTSTEIVKIDGKSWCVVNFDKSIEEEVKIFVGHCFLKEANKFGLDLDEPIVYINWRDYWQNLKDWELVGNVFYNVKKKVDPKFVLVVVPDGQQQPPPPASSSTLNPENLTNLINYYVDQMENDILIHIIKASDVVKYQEYQPAHYVDTLLTLKGKLGGKSWIPIDPVQYFPKQDLPFKMEDTMVVGVADCGITVAAVGSTDRGMTKFTNSVRVQEAEDNIVHCLEEMIVELLDQYHKVNQAFPKNLILFRYLCVSDLKYRLLLKEEIPLIRKAIGAKIKMTVIVVEDKKSHSTRFALRNEDADGHVALGDIPIGTTVDSVMQVDYVGKEMKIFTSHFTFMDRESLPTKYVVLSDGHNLSTEQLQLLCNFVCTNTVGNRAILSLPTVVHYAHKCADRALKHLYAFRLLPEKDDFLVANQMEHSVQLKKFVDRMKEEVRLGDANKNRLYYL